jgi:hypothetical protein
VEHGGGGEDWVVIHHPWQYERASKSVVMYTARPGLTKLRLV